jgi:hypothetical protein
MQDFPGTDPASAMNETTQWRVELFDESDPAQMQRVIALRTSGARVLDTLAEQRQSLLDLRAEPDADEIAEPSHWAYYPWRHTLVHLLGPSGFRRLRLDRNRNKITSEEQCTLSRLRVGIVGLSVGSAIAHALALEGVAAYLRLADFDDLDLSNLNRLSATVLDLGVNKATLAQQRTAELDPYLPVDAWTDGVDESTIDDFLDGLDLVIEECDSFDVKVLVRDRARQRGIPVIMETSDRGLLDVERFDLEPARPLFHGLVGDLDAATVSGLSVQEKIPFGLRILQGGEVSARMAASVLEVGTTVATWPQLAGDVLLGGASVVTAVRRFGLGEALPSGRVRIDIGAHLDQLTDPHIPHDSITSTATNGSRPIDLRTQYDALPDTEAVAFAATRAPSGGNSQPWIIHTDKTALTLRLDEARSSSVDIEYRGSFVAIGAALHNARVAAAHRHILGDTVITGDGKATSVRITFTAGTDISLTDQLPGMLHRGTHRGMPDPGLPPCDPTDLAYMAARLSSPTAAVHLIQDRDTITRLAENISATDRVRFLTDALHREMISELRWPHSRDLSSGIEVSSLGIPTAELAALELLRRPDVMEQLNNWNTGQALRAQTRTRLASSDAVAVITQQGICAADYIRSGACAEEFWIRAQSLGYSLHPLTPVSLYATDADHLRALAPTRARELAALSDELTALIAPRPGEHAALILRIFRTRSSAPTSRRRSQQ